MSHQISRIVSIVFELTRVVIKRWNSAQLSNR